MPKHLYLPEIEGNVGEPPTAGVWHGYDRKLLRAVADGIVVGQSAVGRGVSSVPDAWARPLLTLSALRPGSNHPLRPRLVQEWRGLLSLLALHRLQRYPVDVVPVALDGGELARALRRLLPAPVALEAGQPPYEWTDTLLVRYDGIPVGAFSPATLVYTGADYARRLARTTLPLKDAGGFLAPPGPGQHDELLYVAEWVEQLHERLNARGDGATAILDTTTRDPATRGLVGTINGLLEEWLTELRATVPQPAGADASRFDAPEVEVDPDPIEVRPPAPFLARTRVWREVLRPLRRARDARDLPPSDLLLRFDPQRAAGRTPHRFVVVITAPLLQGGGKIWESRRLSHLGGDASRALDRYFAAPSGDVVDREDLKPRQGIWIRPERYFLGDTLAVTADRAPFLAGDWQRLNGDRHLLLPFTARILDFYTPTEIRDLLQPEYKETDGGIVFSFLLPVGPAGRMERVQRTYRVRNPAPGEGTITSVAVPPVQLFPRFVDPSWRRHYVLQGDAEQVVVRPVVAPGCRVTERVQASAETGRTARAVELAGEGAWPEALVFATVPRPGVGSEAPLGLALVPRPEQPQGLSKTWRVGIDFGTSNTNVFRQDSGRDVAERWTFDFDRYLCDVTLGDAAGRDAVLREFFVPPTAVQLPIPTALRVFQDAQKTHLLLDYFIHFSAAYELPRTVHADIKWDGDEEQQTKYFLESLLFLLLVEVGLQRVKKVELACSYPRAFSVERLARYKGEWEGVVRRLLDDPEQAVLLRRQPGAVDRPEVEGPVFETEGVAAGEFFASEKTIRDPADRAMKQIAAVCLDVGGGTTDISIWHRNDIVFDASVLLAGRQISRLLQQNGRVSELLFSAAGARALEQRRSEPTAFAARLNVVLRAEEGAVRERLIDHANHREVQWIRRVLAVEFGAIAFYTASLLGAVDRRLDGALAREMETRGITLHWGGNAAKLLNWIDFGRHDEHGVASKMLNALLYNALKEMRIPAPPAALGQKQSPGHKSEAAGGLVVMRPGQRRAAGGDDGGWDMPGGASGPSTGGFAGALAGGGSEFDMPDESGAPAGDPSAGGLVSGENIVLTSGPVGHLDPISERMLFDRTRTRFERTSLDRLRRFVEIVNHFGVRFGLFTDDAKIALDQRRQVQIADAVRAHYVEAESQREGQRIVEPVFITEVKILLDFLRNELR